MHWNLCNQFFKSLKSGSFNTNIHLIGFLISVLRILVSLISNLNNYERKVIIENDKYVRT